eukprot:jgi/Ulvmu1/7419/UM036_0079.1
MPVLQPIKYSRGKLELLDQRLLPLQAEYLQVKTCEEAHKRIREMAVRGAPAIAIAGVLALAVELHSSGEAAGFDTAVAAASAISARLDYLVTSRPTAVNLLDAAKKLKMMLCGTAAADGASAATVVAAFIEAAEQMLDDDIAANRAIGAHGVAALDAALPAPKRMLRVLTHCNTGSLATAQYGTALGVIRALHDAGRLGHAYCTETRPYNQGARLTAFELVSEGMPATLVVDSAAAALLASGRVDAVVVGADRVVANGDTANKIGTRMLALVARAASVPFFVAAPTTSVDPGIGSGAAIEIEQRGEEEVTHAAGGKGPRVAAEGIGVWNPAFDVADAADITGIITEKGMIPKKGAAFDVAGFFTAHGMPVPEAAAAPALKPLDEASVVEYVAAHAELACVVDADSGSAGSAAWTCEEIGDGNINFVFVVSGASGAVIVKQGLPYIRCVGESWPLSQERLRVEVDSLRLLHSACPQHVPDVYMFDSAKFIISMQYLAPPHVVLRYGLLDGHTYPRLAQHAAEYLASTLFRTSMLRLSPEEFRKQEQTFHNSEMCALTEQVIFTDPYHDAPVNRHTSPHLDAAVAALRAEPAVKAAAAAAKAAFCSRREALLHGDLHTGSCMVTADTFFVIDTEFAFCGPMAFDVSKLISELLLTFFALDGHSTDAAPRTAQQAYLLQVVCDLWTGFGARFCELWETEAGGASLSAAPVFAEDAAARKVTQAAFMQQLLSDSLRFAGCSMLRRIVGIAHNADFERIADVDARAACEARALRLGRRLLLECDALRTVGAVVQAAREERDDGKQPFFALAEST